MKQWIKRLCILAIAALTASAGYAYQFGGLRARLDIAAFAAPLEACTPFAQDYREPFMGTTLQREVRGQAGNDCTVAFAGFGEGTFTCAIPVADLPHVASGFRATAEDIGLFQGWRVRISTANPDPFVQMLQSSACALDA